jgi:DNA-binding transcriptional regulator YiaG
MEVDGNKIREQRRELALTQTEFADAIGVTLRTVQTWESGRVEIRLRHLRRLAVLTHKSISYYAVAE